MPASFHLDAVVCLGKTQVGHFGSECHTGKQASNVLNQPFARFIFSTGRGGGLQTNIILQEGK